MHSAIFSDAFARLLRCVSFVRSGGEEKYSTSFMKTQLHSLFIVLGLLAGIDQAAVQGATRFTCPGQLPDGGASSHSMALR
jgi:hypothetical protein